MPKLLNQVPKLRLHKASGRAYVTLSGSEISLGKFGTREAQENYHRAIAEWESRGRQARPKSEGLTTRAMWRSYTTHANTYYVKNGKPTSRASIVKSSGEVLCQLYGDLPAAAVGLAELSACRAHLLARGLARKSINDYLSQIRTGWRWACEEGLIPEDRWHALCALRLLRKGRTTAPDHSVDPVPAELLERLLAALDAGGAHGSGPEIAAMVRLQLCTGMRPGEVCALRAEYLDRTGAVWLYNVPGWAHKLEHIKSGKMVPLGPKAQEILTPWLERCEKSSDPVFPTHCKSHFNAHTYGQQIAKIGMKAGLPRVGPNRFRHNAAQAVRDSHGFEAAQALLGHSEAATTRRYAPEALTLAAKVAAERG